MRNNKPPPLVAVPDSGLVPEDDDWSEKTVNERGPGPRVTLADLHSMMGKLAFEVRVMSIVVAAAAVVEVWRVLW